MSGFIYFARAGDFVKIGHSGQPERRLLQFAKYSPIAPELVAVFPAQRRTEFRLHCHLWRYRRNGEWFDWCDEIAAIVANGLPELPQDMPCPHNSDCSLHFLRSHKRGRAPKRGIREPEQTAS